MQELLNCTPGLRRMGSSSYFPLQVQLANNETNSMQTLEGAEGFTVHFFHMFDVGFSAIRWFIYLRVQLVKVITQKNIYKVLLRMPNSCQMDLFSCRQLPFLWLSEGSCFSHLY